MTAITIAVFVLLAGCMSIGEQTASVPAPGVDYEKAGEIEIELRVWNPLFLKSAAQRAALLLGSAEQRARELYGPEAILTNLSLTSRWSPYSLILGLDLFGFAEDGTLRADVLLPVPPPEPEPEPEPEKMIRISYPILPQERFDDTFGYIELEYLTRPEVIEKITMSLDRRNADTDEYQKAYDKVPPGGHLYLNIGRQDLMHANTRWYSYSVIREGKAVIDKRGAEGIPNIKGRDGNWWNVITIPLKTAIDERIEVQIKDIKENLIYDFEIMRLEEEL